MPHRTERTPVTFNCTKETCLDRAGCKRPFRMYVLTRRNVPPPLHRCIQNPQLDAWSRSLITHWAGRACAFFGQLRSCRGQELAAVRELPFWGEDGFRFVLRDTTDRGILPRERNTYFGRAALASTNTAVTRFIPGLDVAIALPGESARERLLPLLAHTRAHQRRWLLTFKGSLAAQKSSREMAVLHHDEQRRVVIVGRYKGAECPHANVNATATNPNRPPPPPRHHSAAVAQCCARLEQLYASYDYDDLMNTTFALLPPGRQHATNRLPEVMAAGAIPVFFGIDGSTLPYADMIDWPALSFNVPADTDLTRDLVPLLERVAADAARIDAMEARVRAVYARYLSGGEEMMNHLIFETFRRRYEFESGRRRRQLVQAEAMAEEHSDQQHYV